MDLLEPSENRYVLHPIKYPDVFKMGKDAIASFWTVEELDFDNDIAEFSKMSFAEASTSTPFIAASKSLRSLRAKLSNVGYVLILSFCCALDSPT